MESSRVSPSPQASAQRTEEGMRFNRTLFAALDALQENNIPYALIGGVASSGWGRPRSTHDIDIFVRPDDAEAALKALERHGFETERTDDRWLYKGFKENMLVDVIFKSQGDIYFDDEMCEHASTVSYHGRQVRTVSPEDLVIIKCAVHNESGPHHWHDALAILSHASIDWNYLLKRSRRAPRRLLALLIYAQSNDIWVPNRIVFDLFRTVFGESALRATEGLAEPTQKPPTPAPGFAEIDRRHEAQAKWMEGYEVGGRREPETYLIARIRETISENVNTAAQGIRVYIEGNRVVAKGEVPTEELREAIEKVMRDQIPDNYFLDNEIRVWHLAGPAGAEEVVL